MSTHLTEELLSAHLYEALTAPRDAGEWLKLACEVEGHPDNAAAAMFGGIAASCQHVDGRVSAQHWRWPDTISFVEWPDAASLALDPDRIVLRVRIEHLGGDRRRIVATPAR